MTHINEAVATKVNLCELIRNSTRITRKKCLLFISTHYAINFDGSSKFLFGVHWILHTKAFLEATPLLYPVSTERLLLEYLYTTTIIKKIIDKTR